MVQGFVDIRKLTIPCPNHRGIFTSKLATEGNRTRLDPSSNEYSKGSYSGNTMADSDMLDINSYTFIDKMGESVVAREYTPVLDGYFDDHMPKMARGHISRAANYQESDDIDMEVSLDMQSSVTSANSNKTMVNIVDAGEKAGRDGSGKVIAEARDPSLIRKLPNHSGLQCQTDKNTDLLARGSEFPTERSLTDSDVPSLATTAADSLYSTDSCDMNKDSDKLFFTNAFQPDKEASLELDELVADSGCGEVGKQDREETPMPPREEGSTERDRVALPTITMALISRRSRHRAGVDEN